MESQFECSALCISSSTGDFTIQYGYDIYLADDQYFAIDNQGNMHAVFRSYYDFGKFITNSGKAVFMEE